MREPSINLEDNQSIFTSEFFTGWLLYLKQAGIPQARFNGTEEDLIYFLKTVCVLLQQTYVGVSSRIGDYDFPIDGTNLALAKVAYWSIANRRVAEHYFPSKNLYQGLKDTDIKWVDFDIWKALPDQITIKVPVRNDLLCNIMGEYYSVDDIVLVRVKQPVLRVHHSELQGVPLTDETEVWFWMTQSRDEADKLLQNSTYGSIVLDSHTKLEDLLDRLVKYAARVDVDLAKQVSEEHIIEMIDNHKKTLKTKYGTEHAEYVKGMLSDRDSRVSVSYQHYKDILEFVLKFVTFKATDQFKRQPIKIPGIKPGKLSAKAQEIQAKLFARYGSRYTVDLPPAPPMPPEEPGSHKTPIRHLVKGFFRQQPYGVGRSLRKTVWILPFWRGTDVV